MPDELFEVDDEVLPLVYFASAPRQNFPIKIGRSTTRAINDRLATLQTGMPYRLEFLVVCRAEPSQELAIHRSFAKDRLEGEWFKRTRDMLEFIKAIQCECPDWRDLLGTRYRLTAAGERQQALELEQEQRRLDELREAMNATEAAYRLTLPA